MGGSLLQPRLIRKPHLVRVVGSVYEMIIGTVLYGRVCVR